MPHVPAFAVDTAFANTEDPVAAYWAGFIAADGCIHYPKRAKTPRLVFNLARADIAHLRKIKTWLRSSNNINPQPKNCVYLCVSNARIVADLKSWGVTSNKTYTLSPPACSPAVDYAYLRGLLDGDGSVGHSWRVYQGKQRTSKYFKPWLSLLIPTPMVSWVCARMPNSSVSPYGNIWQLQWGSFATLDWLHERLYADSTPATRLHRKHVKWNALLRHGRKYYGVISGDE